MRRQKEGEIEYSKSKRLRMKKDTIFLMMKETKSWAGQMKSSRFLNPAEQNCRTLKTKMKQPGGKSKSTRERMTVNKLSISDRRDDKQEMDIL